MKIFKRTVSLFLAFCLCAGMLLLQPQSTVSAAVRNKPTTTVLRMSSNSFDSSAIYVNLPKAKVCYIKNIKTSSKNLIAKNTHYYTTSSDDTYTDTFASIGLYAKKTGKYKVTYNICDKSGNKLSSGKVTVYVKNDLPVKSVKFAGKEVNYALTSKKSGKLSVKMNKGYTLKKITVTTYNKAGKEACFFCHCAYTVMLSVTIVLEVNAFPEPSIAVFQRQKLFYLTCCAYQDHYYLYRQIYQAGM